MEASLAWRPRGCEVNARSRDSEGFGLAVVGLVSMLTCEEGGLGEWC